MAENYFSGQRRVRAILLTQRRTIVLIKRDSDRPDHEAVYIAPGGFVSDDDPSDEVALERELRAQLGAKVKVIRQAMSLFMSQWTFYVCALVGVDHSQRSEAAKQAIQQGEYQIVEVKLNETAIRSIHLQPRALLDYLLANVDSLYK